MHTILVSVWEMNSNIKFAPELWKLSLRRKAPLSNR